MTEDLEDLEGSMTIHDAPWTVAPWPIWLFCTWDLNSVPARDSSTRKMAFLRRLMWAAAFRSRKVPKLRTDTDDTVSFFLPTQAHCPRTARVSSPRPLSLCPIEDIGRQWKTRVQRCSKTFKGSLCGCYKLPEVN